MLRTLAGRRILITGASSGIGRCLAEQAASAGAHLVLAARSADKLDELVRSLTPGATIAVAAPTDLTLESERRRLLETAVQKLGGLDILVNNAGVASWGHFADSTEEILRQVMEVNFFAPAELIRMAIPILEKGTQPAVVNVASMCGRRGMPAWSEYSASKFALVGLTEAFRGELARFDIDILLILPGLTKSNLRHHLLRNEGRMRIDYEAGMPPEEVAAGIWNAVRKNRLETVLGRDAKWMLRLNKFFPRLLDRLIARKVRRLYEEEAVAPVT